MLLVAESWGRIAASAAGNSLSLYSSRGLRLGSWMGVSSISRWQFVWELLFPAQRQRRLCARTTLSHTHTEGCVGGWEREREIYCARSSPETRQQQQPHHFSYQMLAFVLYNMRTAFLTKRPARLRRRCEFHYGIVYQKVMSTFVGNQISGCLRAARTWPKKRFHSGLRLKSTASVTLVSSNFHKQEKTRASSR